MISFLKEFTPKARGRNSRHDDDDDYSGIDSFVPSYVYDALKENKRFDHMRVGRIEVYLWTDADSCISSVNRRTLRNSSDSSSIRWRRSSWQYSLH
jgi:hypothetical protein